MAGMEYEMFREGMMPKIGAMLIIAFLVIPSILLFTLGEEHFFQFVKDYSAVGFFALITLMNVFVQPVSPDIIIAVSPRLLNEPLVFLALLSAGAGVLSGLIDYRLGRLIGNEGFKNLFGTRRFKQGTLLIEKWGVWAIVLSAVTPIPYSVVCWMSGIFRLRLLGFILAVTLTRAPRHALAAFYGSHLIDYFGISFF